MISKRSILLACCLLAQPAYSLETPAPAVDIGSRRELFVDGLLIERLTGKAELQLHHPAAQEITMMNDAPWEGNSSGFYSISKVGNIYRMYYRGGRNTVMQKTVDIESPTFTCYAESEDGIHWRKPNLGRFEFQGSKDNNIIFGAMKTETMDVSASATMIFRDTNPAAAADARYKGILWSNAPKGLMAFKSPDGFSWSPMRDKPVILKAGASMNVAFWDSVRGEYRAYWRHHVPLGEYARYLAAPPEEKLVAPPRNTRRDVRTATSPDFLTWSEPKDLIYIDSPPEELYTGSVEPYFRAPHLFIGFPTRYIERGWSESMRALPDRENRELRAKANERFGTALTESLIMASRDGVTFKRWNEAFIRPGPERTGTWNYGQLFLAWGMVETKSAITGAPNEISLFANERSWLDGYNVMRRYTLRLDGFVSARAPMAGGELITKPVRFTGRQLVLNFSTSAAGRVQVELQDAEGKPLSGFSLDDCPPLFGDAIDRPVSWTHGEDVASAAGKVVRLRFLLKDADVFAFQFRE